MAQEKFKFKSTETQHNLRLWLKPRTDLERDFESYGRIKDIWVAQNPPGFGFIIFDDVRDAVREMDGKSLCGSKIHVELAGGPWRCECVSYVLYINRGCILDIPSFR